jgi:hypothetical protein
MKDPLSRNEMEVLDRQMATLNFQLTEIAHLLEVRLGSTNDLAGSARVVCDQFTKLANRVHRQNALEASMAQNGQTQSQSA